MSVKVINNNSAIIYQTYMDDDTELNGEQALLIQEWQGSGLISITQGDDEIKINYESVDSLMKIFKAIMKDVTLFDVKL